MATKRKPQEYPKRVDPATPPANQTTDIVLTEDQAGMTAGETGLSDTDYRTGDAGTSPGATGSVTIDGQTTDVAKKQPAGTSKRAPGASKGSTADDVSSNNVA